MCVSLSEALAPLAPALPIWAQVHEPILTLSGSEALAADFQACYRQLAGEGVELDIVVPYDDVPEGTFAWLTDLPVAALSLDFLGVPGEPPRPVWVGGGACAGWLGVSGRAGGRVVGEWMSMESCMAPVEKEFKLFLGVLQSVHGI